MSTNQQTTDNANKDAQSSIVLLQDCNIWLEFEKTIAGTITDFNIIDNADDCKVMLQTFLKWSLDNGLTWSEYKNVVDSTNDFNEFIIAYIEEPIDIKFMLQIEVKWQTNWFDSMVDNDAYILSGITINSDDVSDIEYVDESLSPIQSNIVIGSENHLYKPYDNMTQAVNLQYDMINAVNRQLGHVVIYFSHDTNDADKIASLRSFDLIHTGAVRWLKVSVANNDFNVNRVTYDAFDIDFEQGIELHIPKHEYESVFGIGKQPQQYDYLYIPLANRLLEITSVQEEIGLMMSTAWYSCMAKTYEHRPDYRNTDKRDIAANVENILDVDELVETFADYDKSQITSEQIETTALNMFVTNTHIDLSMFDSTRSFVHKAIDVISDVIYVDALPIACGYYNLNGVGNDIAIAYNKPLPNDFAFCCIIKLNDNKQTRAGYWQCARIGDMMLAISGNKAVLLNASNKTTIAKLTEELDINKWSALIVRKTKIGDNMYEIQLSIAKQIESTLQTKYNEIERVTVQLNRVDDTFDKLQMYGLPGYISHVRLDTNAKQKIRMLICSQTPLDTTIIADDGQQIYNAGKPLITSSNVSLSANPNYNPALYVNFMKTQLWLNKANAYTYDQCIVSSTTWHAE